MKTTLLILLAVALSSGAGLLLKHLQTIGQRSQDAGFAQLHAEKEAEIQSKAEIQSTMRQNAQLEAQILRDGGKLESTPAQLAEEIDVLSSARAELAASPYATPDAIAAANRDLRTLRHAQMMHRR
jgi:uncharacterized protein HemX